MTKAIASRYSILSGKPYGWKSLVGCSPCGHEESDTTEQLHFHFSLSCIEEGNDNPLQYSCQEKPRDRGAWWAAIYGVAQSQTWLKRLSSSNSSSKFLFTPNACNLQCCEWITHTLLKPRDTYESPFVAQHFQNCVSQSLVLGMLLWSENESVSHSVMSNSLWPHKL